MTNSHDEIKFADVISALKSLPAVNAPENFEAGLMRRINSEQHRAEESSFKKFFSPSRLIPATALAVSAVIILFVLNLGADEAENPFMLEPPIREDIISSSNMDVFQLPQASEDRSQQTSSPRPRTFGDSEVMQPRSESHPGLASSRAAMESGYTISKAGLDFKRVSLNEAEKRELNTLRERMRTVMEGNTR